jgi:hypothetical protein
VNASLFQASRTHSAWEKMHMPKFAQVKDLIFQLVAIFFAIAIAFVYVSDDGLNKKSIVLSPQLKANSPDLCITAKKYDVSAIKLLFCTRDVQVSYSTPSGDVNPNDFNEHALKPVKINLIVDDDGDGPQYRNKSFFMVVDSPGRLWHLSNLKQDNYQSKTVHLSPFVSVCLQPCKDSCSQVTSTLVVSTFFTSVFVACLGAALILRILAHRYWFCLSTAVTGVALPCIVIFFLVSRKASATWAAAWAIGGGGLIWQYGKAYVWEFVKSSYGQAFLVVYLAAIVAANYFLPTPKYSQKSAVAWLGRIISAAVVLVVSPQLPGLHRDAAGRRSHAAGAGRPGLQGPLHARGQGRRARWPLPGRRRRQDQVPG